MREHLDVLKKCSIQVLCDAIKLRGIMCDEFSHCPCCCQMLIECGTQIFAATIGSQDFNPIVVLLGECPCLK